MFTFSVGAGGTVLFGVLAQKTGKIVEITKVGSLMHLPTVLSALTVLCNLSTICSHCVLLTHYNH